MDSAGTYSTAELAKMLKAPVVLVLDCTKMTRTAAAVLLGMQKFDREVDIKGVVLNHIAGSRHEKIIRETIEKYCGIIVCGVTPLPGSLKTSTRPGRLLAKGAGNSSFTQPFSKQTSADSCQSSVVSYGVISIAQATPLSL